MARFGVVNVGRNCHRMCNKERDCSFTSKPFENHKIWYFGVKNVTKCVGNSTIGVTSQNTLKITRFDAANCIEIVTECVTKDITEVLPQNCLKRTVIK